MRSALALLALAACATAPKPKAEATQPGPAATSPAPQPAPTQARAEPPPPPAAPPARTALHFEFDRADLTTTDQHRLEDLASAMRQRPELSAKVGGHCDELGTEEYNLALGQRRADVAKQHLVGLGIAPDRVVPTSFGEEQPVDAAHTPEAWASNRRAEIDCAPASPRQ
jgi:peptidoglycan-associated lipoprotein